MNVLKAFLLPPGVFILLFAAPCLLARRFRGARVLAAGALVLFYLSMTPYVGAGLLRTLEHVPVADSKAFGADGVGAILVLGAGVQRYAPEYGGVTADSLLLERLRYAARLHRESGLPVYVSGGLVHNRGERVADIMAEVLKGDFAIEVAGKESESSTTFENAALSAKLLKDRGIRKVALVTHAWHMPRSVLSLRAAGLECVPAPTGFTEPIGLVYEQFLPSVRAMARTYYAMHEWLGLAWYWLIEARGAGQADVSATRLATQVAFAPTSFYPFAVTTN